MYLVNSSFGFMNEITAYRFGGRINNDRLFIWFGSFSYSVAFAPLQSVWSINRDRPPVALFFTPCPLKFDLVCRTWLLPFLLLMAHVKRKRRLKHWRAKHERWTDVCISHRVCTFLKLVRVEMGYDNTVQSIQWNVYFFKMPSRYYLVCIVCVCLGLLRYLLTFCTVTHRLYLLVGMFVCITAFVLGTESLY